MVRQKAWPVQIMFLSLLYKLRILMRLKKKKNLSWFLKLNLTIFQGIFFKNLKWTPWLLSARQCQAGDPVLPPRPYLRICSYSSGRRNGISFLTTLCIATTMGLEPAFPSWKYLEICSLNSFTNRVAWEFMSMHNSDSWKNHSLPRAKRNPLPSPCPCHSQSSEEGNCKYILTK